MASDTRKNICTTAIRLFNEEGVDAVSLRRIAAEAGTTIGNLTYHFAKKDDLLQAILADLHAGFSGKLDESLAGEPLLARIVELLRENEENQRAYPFYFENISQVLRQSTALSAEADAFARDLYGYYSRAFEQLCGDGWLRDGLSHACTDALAYTFVQMESGWVEANAPFANDLLPRLSVSVAACRLLEAYVAPARQADYLRICEEKGVEL